MVCRHRDRLVSSDLHLNSGGVTLVAVNKSMDPNRLNPLSRPQL
jgi:hypothetical protein